MERGVQKNMNKYGASGYESYIKKKSGISFEQNLLKSLDQYA